MDLDLDDLVGRVTDYTIRHPDERDPWERAPAMSGILAWNREDAVAEVRRWIDRAVATQSSDGYLNYQERIELSSGHVRTFTPTASLSCSLARPMLELHDRTPDPTYLEAAKRQMAALERAPRTKDGGISCRLEANELWVDFTYLTLPFMARLGTITGVSDLVDEAFRQFEIHAKHLVDPHAHLTRHAWCEMPNSFPQSTFWARGNGWLIACAVDLIAIAPDHPRAAEAGRIGRDTLVAMQAYQDRSGFFRHILDDRFSKFEASASVMFAYAATKAVGLGLVGEEFVESSLRAFRVVAGSIQPDGAVPGVAVPPGGPGVPFGTAAFGQGFFLLAAHGLRTRLG